MEMQFESILNEKPEITLVSRKVKRGSQMKVFTWVIVGIFLAIVAILSIFFISESICFESEFPKNHPLRQYYDFKYKTLKIPKGTDVGKIGIHLVGLSKLRLIDIPEKCFGNATELIIDNLPQLESLKIEAMVAFKEAENLIFRNMPKLTYFYFQCHQCFHTTKEIRLEGFPLVKQLIFGGNTAYESVEKFIVADLPSLEDLRVNAPYSFHALQRFEVVGFPKLTNLLINGMRAYENLVDFSIRDLASLPEFRIQMSFGFSNMRRLEIARLPKCKVFFQRSGSVDPVIEEISVTDMPALESIDLANAVYPHLKKLTLNNLTNLTSISFCTGREKCFGNLTDFKLSGHPKLRTIQIDPSGPVPVLSSLELSDLPSLTKIILPKAGQFVDMKQVVLRNLTSFVNMTFDAPTVFPALQSLEFNDLPNFQKLVVNATEFTNVNEFKLIDLPAMESLEILGNYSLSAIPSDKGSLYLKNIPKVHRCDFGAHSGDAVPFYQYKYVYRGQGVSDSLYTPVLSHLRALSKYKNEIEEKEW